MICSDEWGFIFLKTRKTAGTSVELALSTVCGPSDIITSVAAEDEARRDTMGARAPQNTEFPFSRYGVRDWGRLVLKGRRARTYEHMPARAARQRIGHPRWDSYTKFSIVRNPWDMVISGANYNDGGGRTVSEFMATDHYSRLKTSHDIFSIGTKIVADRILRFETLSDDFRDMAHDIGLPEDLELPRAKGSYRKDRRHYREILTETEAARIAEDFAWAINQFGYEY